MVDKKVARRVLVALLGLAFVVSAGCSSTKPPPAKKKDFWEESRWPYLERITDPAELPDYRPIFLDRNSALVALEQSEIYFKKPSSKKWFPYKTNDADVTHERQVQTLHALRRILETSSSPDEFHGWCLRTFDVYRSVGAGRTGAVLYTAYCEPIFDGRREPSGEFVFPLYTLPEDLVKDEDGKCLGRKTSDGQLVSYYSRGELEKGGMLRGRELVYLKDPFEVYIVHVQGSARINLPDGTQMCIGYAGKTDRPYTSIGKKLIEEGKIPKEGLSLTALKNYFKQSPAELDRVLPMNESYVFFMEREPGPWGSIGSKVTPFHTVATDKEVFPRGGPVVAEARLPVTSPSAPNGVEFRPATTLLFDQDTGGAIKAAGRADIFIGTGPEAERLAGYTQEEGRLLYLFVKDGAMLP